ncbi:SecY-interacting protein [Glaciecola sp. KUL10]|uniref:SecY-interacting protein n=1 Tax=Glaciecola sp. (strain KUL10) TaxID=2161813 RepID=UPI000D78308B|nr:SecY-interacting protein [Glaciecola sp. KUL10]GBL04146.1 SecY interacting protein Syd [Glaciecola sp. KUL10]
MITQALDVFINKYIDLMRENNSQLLVDFDEEWTSPCLDICRENVSNSVVTGETLEWRPVRQDVANSMDNIASALELEIPEELSIFFTRYYSLDLPAKTERGELSLIQVWNQHDFERLQGNLIAHVLMKRRLKQPETLFFAATDDDDFIVSIDCASSKVMLEQIGLTPKETLAESLTEFIDGLTPLAKSSSL